MIKRIKAKNTKDSLKRFQTLSNSVNYFHYELIIWCIFKGVSHATCPQSLDLTDLQTQYFFLSLNRLINKIFTVA